MVWRTSRNHLHYFMVALRQHHCHLPIESDCCCSEERKNKKQKEKKTPTESILMDDIPKWWAFTWTYSWLTPSSSLGWRICDTHIIYFSWFMLNSIFARISVSFWFTTILFWAHATMHWYGKKRPMSLLMPYHFFFRFDICCSNRTHVIFPSAPSIECRFTSCSSFFFSQPLSPGKCTI